MRALETPNPSGGSPAQCWRSEAVVSLSAKCRNASLTAI